VSAALRYALQALFWAGWAGAYFAFPDYLPLLGQIAIMAIFVLSLDLLVGYAGFVTLGHAAFLGVGAYAAGILAQQGFGDPIVGLFFAAAVAALVGFATAPLVLRGGDLAGLMVTLGIALMLYEAANRLAWLTGGSDGLQGVEMGNVLGLWRFDLFGRVAYLYSLAVLVVLFLLARLIVASPFGLALRGIKGNRRRMEAIGTPVQARLIAVYTLSAAYAGVAGALLAQTTQFVSLDVLSFGRSAEALLMLVLGGMGSLYGGMIGAVLFMLAHHSLSELTPQFWQFWIGIALIALAIAGRGGVVGLVARLLPKRRPE
jgi:branched-chain amino acid transport system permease protein